MAIKRPRRTGTAAYCAVVNAHARPKKCSIKPGGTAADGAGGCGVVEVGAVVRVGVRGRGNLIFPSRKWPSALAPRDLKALVAPRQRGRSKRFMFSRRLVFVVIASSPRSASAVELNA